MEIITKKVKDLKPYERNPRRNDDAVKYVAESIEQFGFKVPIVIEEDGTVICGHTRLKAAKKLHLAEVPCIVADDLDDEQIKAFRLADNNVLVERIYESDKRKEPSPLSAYVRAEREYIGRKQAEAEKRNKRRKAAKLARQK